MNFADGLRAGAARLGDRPALVAGTTTVGYAELDARVDRAAAALAAAGQGPGDRVALLLGSTPVFVEVLYGALRAGLVAVPLNTALAPGEVTAILGDADARVVVADESFAGLLDGVLPALPGLEVVVAGGAAPPPAAPPREVRGWRQLLDRAAQPPSVGVGGDDLALLAYTSGTTGRPKGAMLTHANLLANHEQMAATRLAVDERDVVLCLPPLFHIYGLNVALGFCLARGATVVLVERFDPVASLAEVAARGVTVVVGAPPVYVAWVDTAGVHGNALGSVRFALSGAAPLPPAVLRRCHGGLGLTVYEGYGLAEAAPVLTSTVAAPEIRPGSVGRPLPGVTLRLLDDHGAEVRAGDPGEVVARGPNVFAGYWRQPRATAEALRDGWLHTGDVGLLDGGDLYLVDRKSDLILVSGFNVYPREVEEVLARHPKVAEAAVVGAPHPSTGETVKAVVVLRPGEEADADELHDHCRRHLARFKCPGVVEFAEALPHNVAGKVVRRELRSRDSQ